VKNRYPNRRKKILRSMEPNSLYFSPDLPGALGKVAIPQKTPAIDPPRLPDQETIPAVRAIFIKMNRTTMNTKMHRTCSSSCDLLN